MTEYITPTTWEQCARHVPGESAAPYPHTVTPEVPDGYEAVWLPSETVDEFDAGEDDRVSRGHVVAGAREAQARRGTTPAPPPAPSPAPDDLVSRARGHVDTHPESRELIEELLEELLEAVVRWACFAAPPPVPSWPGAVLSGLTDEDGVPTWLAQAGQVRGEQVRFGQGGAWWPNTLDDYDPALDFDDDRWVEVRAPRPVPVPETERVPWWEALGRLGLAGDPFVEVGSDDEGPWVRVVEGGTKLHSPVAPDGTVEVLKDGES